MWGTFVQAQECEQAEREASGAPPPEPAAQRDADVETGPSTSPDCEEWEAPDGVPREVSYAAGFYSGVRLRSVVPQGGLPRVAATMASDQAHELYFPSRYSEHFRHRFDPQEAWEWVEEARREMPPEAGTVRRERVPGRNEACRCGSGRKFKRCCGT